MSSDPLYFVHANDRDRGAPEHTLKGVDERRRVEQGALKETKVECRRWLGNLIR